MNNYTYSEIQNMQKRAMERVREMQKNSEQVLNTAQRDLSYEQSREPQNNSSVIKSKVTNLPPNFPEKKIYSDFKEYFNKETQKQSAPKQKTNLNSIESILNEPDRAILLGLIMLLKSEGADEMLIMALMYILS